jgi:hypothetical protein
VAAADEPTLLDRFFRRGDTSPPASIFMFIGVLGGIALGFFVARMAEVPWHLDARSPVVTAVGSECGPLTGGRFVIEVDGERHLCTGSDNKCGFEGAIDIAYDPDDPSACRAAHHVDDLSRYELLLLIMSLAFVSLGLSGASYVVSETLRRKDLEQDEPSRVLARRRLRTATKVLMAAAAIAVNVAGAVIAFGM